MPTDGKHKGMALPHDHCPCAAELHRLFDRVWNLDLQDHKNWVVNNPAREYLHPLTGDIHTIYSDLDKAVSYAQIDGDIAWCRYSAEETGALVFNMVMNRGRHSDVPGQINRLELIWMASDEEYACEIKFEVRPNRHGDNFETNSRVVFFSRDSALRDIAADRDCWKPVGKISSEHVPNENIHSPKRYFYSLDDVMWDKFKHECLDVPRHTGAGSRNLRVVYNADDERQARAMRKYAISSLRDLYMSSGSTGELFSDRENQNIFYYADNLPLYIVVISAQIPAEETRCLYFAFAVRYRDINMHYPNKQRMNEEEIKQLMVATDDEIVYTFPSNAGTGAVCTCCGMPIKPIKPQTQLITHLPASFKMKASM